MFNLILRTSCPVFVLISGLVSCAPDEKSRDRFVAPVPRIVRALGTVELAAWDKAAVRELDLHDALDARTPGLERIEVVSRCRKDGAERLHKVSLPGHEPIPIYQTLSDALLATDLMAKPVTCSFELTLLNGHGSKHIFNLIAAQMHGRTAPAAQLTAGGDTLAPGAFLEAKKLAEIKLRAPNGFTGQAALVCERAKSKPLPMEAVLDLADFDLHGFTPYPDEPADILAQEPQQLCRAVLASEGRIRQITPLFRLYFAPAPLRAAATVLPQRASGFYFYDNRRAAAHKTGEYRIANPGSGPRWVRIQKAPLTVQFVALPAGLGSRPSLSVTPLNQPGVRIEDQGPHWRITIAARNQLTIQTHLHTPASNPACREPVKLFADFPQPLVIEELSAGDQPVSPIALDLGPRYILTAGDRPPTAQELTAAGKPGPLCFAN